MKNDKNEKQAKSQEFSRRSVLGSSATLAAASLLSGQATASSRSSSLAKPVLVHVFLRGAMDGLTTVPPYGDANLYVRRPGLAIQPPGSTNGARDLDGFFGLAPAAAPLLTPYSDGHLAVVHACGSSDATRSHFEGYIRMEGGDGTLPDGVISTGWITRYLGATAAQATSDLRAIGTGPFLPYTLRGAPGALPIPDLANFRFPGRPTTAVEREAAISDAYARRLPPVSTTAMDTIASFGMGGIDFVAYTPENGAVYPAAGIGIQMRNTAALIKGAIGDEVITIDVEGWDLHAQQGPINGSMARLLTNLTKALEAFYLDMLGHLNDYVVVVVSEFGRHVKENSSDGSDHGHGNAMFLMGGGIAGGQVFADWPGLGVSDLDQGDLAITIDYRDILGEVVKQRFGVTDPSTVFPSHAFTTYGVTV